MIKFNSKRVTFDVETSEQAMDDKISPITVGSTVTSDGEVHAWFSHQANEQIVGMKASGPSETWEKLPLDGRLSPLMSKSTANCMLNYMAEKVKQGYSLIAWNGAGFDLKMLGHLAGNLELAGRLAMGLIDPMYQVLSLKGFPVGLSAAQKGLGLAQEKTMSGKDAPEAWANGEYQKVVGYVVGDSQITMGVVEAICKNDGIAWVTKTQKQSRATFYKLKTVVECLLEPKPNTEWMDKPIDKRKILDWIPANVINEAVDLFQKKQTEQMSALQYKGKTETQDTDEVKGSKPVLFVVSGPSGVGKSVLCEEVIRTMPSIQRIVTTTTRAPRSGEVDSVDYTFVSKEKFEQMVSNGEFLEWAEFNGHLYGSPKAEVSSRLAKKEDVLVILDVNGAEAVRKFMNSLPPQTQAKFRFADIFILPPSMDELRKRLLQRNKDVPESIEKRLAVASEEIKQAPLYKYTIVNKHMNRAWDQLRSIVVAERSLSN